MYLNLIAVLINIYMALEHFNIKNKSLLVSTKILSLTNINPFDFSLSRISRELTK